MKILIVEDEKDLCLTIAKGLKINGYFVDCVFDGKEGLYRAIDEFYDLIILDLNLPNVDGIEILKDIRKVNKVVKIIILTARTQISDKILGLDLGANDYITKPFHFEELEARIRSLLRQNIVMTDSIITCDELVFDTANKKCCVNEVELDLTNREMGLLECLLHNKNRYVKVDELLEKVWSGDVDGRSNSVRVHISSLRKKIKNEVGYDMIINKINVGYSIIDKVKT